MSKTSKSLLALLLVVAMLIPGMNVFAANGLAGDAKAKIELVSLVEDSTAAIGFKEAVPDDISVNDTVYVGLRAANMSAISNYAEGLYAFSTGFAFNAKYLECEEDAMGPQDERLGYSGGLLNGKYGTYAYSLEACGVAGIADVENGIEMDEIGYSVAWNAPTSTAGGNAVPTFKQDTFYLAIIAFKVKEVPEGGATAFSFDLSEPGTTCSMKFGKRSAGLDHNWYTEEDDPTGDNNDTNMRLQVEFNASGANIFPATAAKPTLNATVTITGTAKYGETLTASVSGASLSDSSTVDASKYTIQWQRSNGANWDNITTNGTGATYKLVKDDYDKQIRCTLTSTDYKVGTITCGATAKVGKRALNLGTTPVFTVASNATAGFAWTDDTTTAQLTKSLGNFNFAPTGNDATAVGMISGDSIRFTGVSVVYTAQTTAGTQSLTTTTYTFSDSEGNNKYYSLAANTPLTVSGYVKASALNTIAVTKPTNMSYSLKNGAEPTVDLTGMTVTRNYTSGKSNTLNLNDLLTAGGVVKVGSTVVASSTVANNSVKVTAGMKGAAITVELGGKTASTTEKLTVETDATVSSWTATQKNFTYEDGATITLDGVKVTATMSDGTTPDVTSAAVFKIDGQAITVGTTTATMAMNGKTITVEYNSDPAKTVGTITVTPKTSVDVVVTAGAAADKAYDAKTDGVVWTTEPTFTAPSGYTLDTTGVTYAYADANAGTGVEITVSGLKVDGAAGTTIKLVDGTGAEVTSVGTGDITQVAPTITLGNLAQTVGSVTPVTATASPVSSAEGDELTVQVKIVTTVEDPGTACDDADPENHDHTDGTCSYVAPSTTEVETWTDWADAAASLTQAGTYKVRAKVGDADTVNFVAGTTSAEADLVLSNRPTGGVAPVIPNHEAYIIGDDNGFFRPNDGMTRAEAAVILARASEDFNESAAYSTTMSDAASHWGANYIGFAASKGIVTGRPGGIYDPNGKVTRAELAVMVARFVGIAPNNSAYAFADTNGHWAESYIAALKAAGIVIGDGNGFRPDAPISRAEAVTMINRALERTPDAAKVQSAVTASPFYDVKRSDWFFAQVIEAAVAHKPADYHG